MLHFHILTLFPDSFSYLNESILNRAVKNKKIKIQIYNLRDFTVGKHKTADDKPYGGGPGMVLKAEPIVKAVGKIKKGKKNVKIILFAADGKQFTNVYAKKLSQKHKDIILISGHYEGVDERVAKILKAEKVSIGPYILTGGELPAMILTDAISRQIQGVLGKHESLEESRDTTSKVYTRPETIVFKKKKYTVPEVLLSGDHKKIEEWRKNKK
ncbi:MAG: tRNA (guanosine(37)-N1)-methyltransferase TrmD [Parcubacteria group bacterium]|nr:tRNA (guanosine(37)-N1)-methyltransferase TrmD [Parcubacteria group bacterium]